MINTLIRIECEKIFLDECVRVRRAGDKAKNKTSEQQWSKQNAPAQHLQMRSDH